MMMGRHAIHHSADLVSPPGAIISVPCVGGSRRSGRFAPHPRTAQPCSSVDEVCIGLLRSTRYIPVVAVVVAVGVRSRQACARRRIPIPDRRVLAATRELLAVGTEAHGCDDVRVPPQGAYLLIGLRVEDYHAW